MTVESEVLRVSKNSGCTDCTDERFCNDCWNEGSMVAEVTDLLKSLIPHIDDDFVGPDDDGPVMQVTIASDDGDEWTYQTGDNSFMGSCYHYRFWGTCWLERDSDCADLARDMVDQIFDQLAVCND